MDKRTNTIPKRKNCGVHNGKCLTEKETQQITRVLQNGGVTAKLKVCTF